MHKNILVTGCSKGLGLTVCENLLSKDYHVYGISRSTTEGIERMQQDFPEQFHHLSFDLSDPNQIKDVIFKNWITNKVPIHGLVNNAAIAYDDIITNLNYEPLKTMFDTNVFSPFMLTKYAIRNMIFNHVKGSIIHISSISVHTGYKGLSMYAATKGALEAFSKNTAREWGEKGIRSNCIVAGFMETEMSSGLTDEMKDRIYKRTSLKSATSPQSVSATIEFLLSDISNSVTGQNWHVDSGTI